jgi:ABC-type dipeptide/oligopeptide/nickel transport system permease subunit
MASWIPGSATRRRARRLLATPAVAGGLALIVAVLAIGAIAPWLAGRDPLEQDLAEFLQPPSAARWFGTDDLGRDLWSRVIVAARADLALVVLGIGVAVVLALPLGLVAGYFRGPLDRAITALSDAVLTFPTLVLAVVLVSLFGAGLRGVVAAVGLTTAPALLRLIRALVLQTAALDFVDAARALGAGHVAILARHVVPNILGRGIVYTTLLGSHALLTVTALGFLGLGIQPPAPEWGNMLANARTYLGTAPWLTLFPALAIVAFILGLNLLGEALRDLLDPKLLWRP